jgi:hypothetical protein
VEVPTVVSRIARTIDKVTTLLDAHSESEQIQAMAFLVARYPRCAEDSDREWERVRKADWRTRQRLGDNGTSPTGHVPGTDEVLSSLEVNDKTLELLETARKQLGNEDFDFLTSCPEPFKSQWLKDPDWWISVKDGYPKIRIQIEASKCMGYVQGKFSVAQQQRLNLRERFRRWVAKADAWRENKDERKAVRR